jgi:predicted  nucleic acid-binding Zn-ribbon protein
MALATEVSIEQKLKALYRLQIIDSQISKLQIVRGELPNEVADLEDDIAGMETRLANMANDVKAIEETISQNKTRILDAKALAKKYEKQLEGVKNNREYDALNKEIEIQGLEQQAADKRIKNANFESEQKKNAITAEASKTIFLGFNFDNDFVDQITEQLKQKCPQGVVSGILTKDEVISYFLFHTRKITATGFCNSTTTAAK